MMLMINDVNDINVDISVHLHEVSRLALDSWASTWRKSTMTSAMSWVTQRLRMGCSALGCKVGDFHVGGAISMTNWQTICSFFGAKQTLQIQGCTALTTVLLVLLFGWGVWLHSHFLDVVAIPQNTRPIVASFPICVDSSPNMWPKPMPSFVLGWLVDLGKAYIVVPGNSLMDWIYGHKQTVIFQISGKERVPSPTIGSVWRKC